MGTRGAIGWILPEGTVQATYNHFDSGPSELGISLQRQILKWGTHEMPWKDHPVPLDRMRAMRWVDEDDKPTMADREAAALNETWDKTVSEGDDWYALLRNQQGNLNAMLINGIMIKGGENFLKDSLFCEWAYILDFRDYKFEMAILRGFNKDPDKQAPYCRFNPETDTPEHRIGEPVEFWGCSEIWRGGLADFLALDMDEFEEKVRDREDRED